MPTAAYTLRSGERIPGVTTVAGRFKDSAALLFWAFKQGKSGAERLYDSAEKAASIGTLTHSMIETHIDGEDPYSTLCELTPALADPEMGLRADNAFKQYLKWEEQSGIKFLSKYQEISLVSEEYKFGGTPDALGKIGNELVLIDWKTSNAVYMDYLLQLAAYKHLVEEGKRLDTREKLGLGKVKGFHLLRIAKDYPDFEHRYFGELDLAWEQFLLFRQAYENDKELKKRVK
jgi:hypothetical protein